VRTSLNTSLNIPSLKAPVQASAVRFSGTNPEESVLTVDQIHGYEGLLNALKALVFGGVFQKDLAATTGQFQAAAQAFKNLPQGKFDIKDGKYVIDPMDGEAPIEIATDKRQVFGPGTDLQTFLTESFGKKPKLVICPVGWTVPDPDNVGSLNPKVAAKYAEKRAEAAKTAGADSGPAFDKAYTKLKKQVLKNYYESAFKQWWAPVQKELMKQLKERGFETSEVCFLTSASYDGVDKAAIDFAKQNGMKVANVTPYTYARWMNQDSSDPLLVTNTISDYADACAAADVTFVTGGRDHALGEDIARGLIGKKTTVIVADILKEEHGLTVPAWKDGKIENAAAYMQDQGLKIANMALAENPVDIPGLRGTQLAAVAVLQRLFNQINI
jgi:phosphoglycolate phosphatase-like HAD superfamily hydrolase